MTNAELPSEIVFVGFPLHNFNILWILQSTNHFMHSSSNGRMRRHDAIIPQDSNLQFPTSTSQAFE